MRIIAGAWRGRTLIAPEGEGTRPTADRVRQALFDRLLHASWAGREAVEGASVLDAFAGTGALGLEALSRGAASAVFIENDPKALLALRKNVAAADGKGRVVAGDVLRPPPGRPCTLVFLDPPYGSGLILPAVAALRRTGWMAPAALVIAELGREETCPVPDMLAEWAHGTARMLAWQEPA